MDLVYVLAEFIVYNADTLNKEYDGVSEIISPRAFVKEFLLSYYGNLYSPEELTTALADEKLSRTIKLVFWRKNAEDSIH